MVFFIFSYISARPHTGQKPVCQKLPGYFHIRAREKQTEKENAAKIRNMKIGYLRVFPSEL